MNPDRAAATGQKSRRLNRGFVLAFSCSLTALAVSSCRTSSTKTIEAAVPSTSSSFAVVPNGPEVTILAADSALGAKEVKARPLTSAGLNRSANIAASGKHLVFISRSRSSHRQAQVYELDLERRIERRVTFHDGDDSGVVYVPNDDRIVYASSTDEIKEDPVRLENLRRTFGPTSKGDQKANASSEFSELYVQSLNGRDLERLTYSPGYDAEPAISPDGSMLVFTSTRSGAPSLHTLRLLKGALTMALSSTTAYDSQARFSPDGKGLVWSRYAKDRLSARLVTAVLNASTSAVRNLTDAAAEGEQRLDLHPVWHPDGKSVIFSSNRRGRGFDLYQLDVELKCLKRLTDAAGDEIEPALSPDGKRLVFTRSWNGSVQLYAMDLTPPSGCL